MGNLASGYGDDGTGRLVLKVNDHVQYFSETHDAWIDCVVTSVAAEGAVEVSCKRGHWMPLEEQLAKLRPIGGAAAFTLPATEAAHESAPPPLSAGDVVMYWSSTHSRWVPSRVVGVKTTGEVQVEVKPGHWMSHEEQGAKLRSPLGLGLDCDPIASGKIGSGCSGPALAPASSERLELSAEALAAHNKILSPSDRSQHSPLAATATPASRAPSLDSFVSYSPGGGAWGSTAPNSSGSLGIFGSMSSVGEPRGHTLQDAQPLGSFASLRSDGFESVFGGLATADSFTSAVSGGAADFSSVLASMASFGSVSSLPAASPGGRVGFDPSVEVMAFKGSCPASKIKSKGRSFESSFERRVEVPKAWSFGSMSSMSSLSSAGGHMGSMGTMPASRLQPLHEDMELVPQRA